MSFVRNSGSPVGRMSFVRNSGSPSTRSTAQLGESLDEVHRATRHDEKPCYKN